MTVLPWRSERALDAEGVRRLVDSQFPALAPCSASYRAEGFDSEVFDVTSAGGEEWIFRFPKRAEVQPWLEKELRLLPRLAPHLPIAIPDLRCRGRADQGFPFLFMGYPRLAGVPGTRVDPTRLDRHALAAQLGAFLRVLHAFPAEEALSLGAGVAFRRDVAEWHARMRSRVERVHGVLPPDLAGRLLAHFADDRNAPAHYEGTARLVHNDLYGEHVLVDPTGGRAVGVIDWSDVVVGDPALDFAALRQWLGEDAIETALAEYGQAVDPAFHERVRAGAICHGLGCLYYGVEGGRPDFLEIGRRSLERELPG